MNLRRLLALAAALALLLPAAATAAPAASFLAGPCVAGGSYDPACDVDHDGDVDIFDIQLTAGRWNTNGVWTADGWSLTGNAGTTPGTNFLGTTDDKALELHVNGTRGLLIQPYGLGRNNIIGGHSDNGVTPGVFSATIGGGGAPALPNWVYDNYGTVDGGAYNKAGNNDGGTGTAQYATVGGGYSNTASGVAATVAGGSANTASGQYAIVPGGSGNLAGGNYSLAAGYRAKTSAQGAFVWADSSNFDFAPGAANAFSARTTGGFRIILGIDGAGAATWQCTVYDGGSWGCSSDRNVKENFEPVDGRAILEKLATLPITTWNAIGTDPNVRRMGPMAQDFYATFGLGDDDKVITTGDLDGVALASIQGLYEIVQEKDAQIVALQQENADLQARLAAIEQALGIGQ